MSATATRTPGRARTSWLAARAFLRIGYLDARAYPLAFVLGIAAHLTNVFLYYFMAKIVDTGDLVAGDYFAFAVIGVLVFRVLGAGLEEFGLFVQRTVDQGQLELYLVQPVSWTLLPFAWFQWLLVSRLIAGGITMLVGVWLGASFELDRLPLACLVLALGIAATHAIGVVAASVRILAKRVDPVLLFYSVGSTVFSGMFVPIQLLPGPLQALSWVLPHTYAADALRQLLLERGAEGSRLSVGDAIVALLLFTVVTYAVALVLFNRAIGFARARGLLGAY